MIKKYLQFMNERQERNATAYEFGCVLLELDLPGWEKITSFIDPADLYQPEDGRHGLETNPHLSLKFGLEANVSPQAVAEIIDKYPLTQKIQIEKIDLFQNNEFEVVKFKVVPNPEIIQLNQELSKLPNQDKFPNYIPHLTIAYVKPGTGYKYIQDFSGLAQPYQIVYSMPSGDKFYFKIEKIS